MQYKMGDIVFASEAVQKQSDNVVKSHLFVLIDDDGNVVPAEYFGFVVSSNLDKSKENSSYKYNEVIEVDSENHLKTKSIVKCDQLMSIPTENINKKIGTVDEDDLIRFLDAFEDYLNKELVTN